VVINKRKVVPGGFSGGYLVLPESLAQLQQSLLFTSESYMSNEDNIFITSHNQSGGVTAHTVNFGPTARTMNAQLGGQLKQHIPATAKVTITVVLGDGEAFSFANQVMTWLRENGYINVDGVNQAVYSQPVMGQNLNKINDGQFELIIGTRQ
jgi:hypothetical protein